MSKCARVCESNEPCAFSNWMSGGGDTRVEGGNSDDAISVCRTAMGDSPPSAAGLVLNAEEESVKESGSGWDGTELDAR